MALRKKKEKDWGTYVRGSDLPPEWRMGGKIAGWGTIGMMLFFMIEGMTGVIPNIRKYSLRNSLQSVMSYADYKRDIGKWNEGGFRGMIWPLLLNSEQRSILGAPRSMRLGNGYGCRAFGGSSRGSFCWGARVRDSQGNYVRAGGLHRGHDITGSEGNHIFAMADGVVIRAIKKYGPEYDGSMYRNLLTHPEYSATFKRKAPRAVYQIYRSGGFDALPPKYRRMVRNGRWWAGSCGNVLKIRYFDGLVEALLCHSRKILVNEKATVSRGDIVATMGTTGNSTGTHIHLTTLIKTKQDGVLGYWRIPPRILLPLNIPESPSIKSYFSEYDAQVKMYMYRPGFPRLYQYKKWYNRFLRPPALLYPLARMTGSETPYAFKSGYAKWKKKGYWLLRELVTETGLNRYYLYNEMGGNRFTPKDILIGPGLREYGPQHMRRGMQFATDKKPHLKDIALAGKKIWGFLPHLSAKWGYITHFTFERVQRAVAGTNGHRPPSEVHKSRCRSGKLFLIPFEHDGVNYPNIKFYGELRVLSSEGKKQLTKADEAGCKSAPAGGFKDPGRAIRFYGIHERKYLVDRFKSRSVSSFYAAGMRR